MSRARILEVLARHDARNPLASGDLLALVGGCEADTWQAIEGLVQEHSVLSCYITRPGGSVVVFWPAGKVARHLTAVQQARKALKAARAKKAAERRRGL